MMTACPLKRLWQWHCSVLRAGGLTLSAGGWRLCLRLCLCVQVVVVQELDELCELVDILKHEVLGEQLHRRSAGADALRAVMARCLADVQGRLIFRAQVRASERARSPPARGAKSVESLALS